jgi:hypothetical protein
MIQIKTIRYIASVDNFTDVVINLDWEYSLEGFQSISGTLSLSLPSPENFIPIDALTEDVMITWVENLVNPTTYQLLPIVYDEQIIKEITL